MGKRYVEHKENHYIKDERWLRKSMHIPTHTDYPDLSEAFFKEPKPALHNATQKFGSLDVSFEQIRTDLFVCHVKYDSPARTVEATSEGRSKVSYRYIIMSSMMLKDTEIR